MSPHQNIFVFKRRFSYLVSPQSSSAAPSPLDPEHSLVHPGVSSGISCYHGQTIYSREIYINRFFYDTQQSLSWHRNQDCSQH